MAAWKWSWGGMWWFTRHLPRGRGRLRGSRRAPRGGRCLCMCAGPKQTGGAGSANPNDAVRLSPCALASVVG
jgi:hypothetical protein